MHGAALDGARADERDLDDKVVEASRAQPRQGVELGAALNLEHADRVATAEHVVDPRLLLRDRVERPLLTRRRRDHTQRLVDRAQHAKAEQIELHEPHRRAVVLVPLQHGALLHARVLDRADLADGALGEHHPARVDAEMPGRPLERVREPQYRLRDRGVWRVRVGRRGRAWPPAGALAGVRRGILGLSPRSSARLLGGERVVVADAARPRALLGDAVAERLRGVPDRRLRAVGDDVRDLGRVAPAVLLVDVLDHLLAPLGVEVDVNVWLLLAQARKETLERETVEDRIDRGDLQQVTDRRVRRGPPALAEDPACARLPHNVVHDEEVAGEIELLDHVELAFDALAPRGVEGVPARAVSLGCALPHELPQPAHLRVPLREVEFRQPRGRLPERERELARERHGPRDGIGVAGEVPEHGLGASEVRRAGGGEMRIELGEAAPRPHRGHRLGGTCRRPGRGVHRARRERRQTRSRGELGERRIAGVVAGMPVMRELDVDVVAPEQRREPLERHARRRSTVALKRAPHLALAAPGEHRPLALARGGELRKVVDGASLLAAGELALSDGGGEPVIASGAAREQQQVASRGVSRAKLRGLQPERELRPVDGEKLRGRQRCLREPWRPVEAVVIGEREPREAEPLRLGDELLGGGGTVEKAVVRVRVELRVLWGIGRAGRASHTCPPRTRSPSSRPTHQGAHVRAAASCRPCQARAAA